MLMVGVDLSFGVEKEKATELYAQGVKVFKADPKASIRLFAKAAKRGNTQSMVVLGHCYRTGSGVKASRRMAMQWYERAVAAGDLLPLYELGQLHAFADPRKKILPDYTKAIDYYEKAVEQGSLRACAGLAGIYASAVDPEFHDGGKAVKYAAVLVRKNPKEAEGFDLLAAAYARNVEFELAMKAAKQSITISSLDLVEMRRKRIEGYKNGRPVPALATEDWFLRAADHDSLWAMTSLARLHEDRDGGIYDPSKGRFWHTQAVEEGSRESLMDLGKLCRRGIGGPVDMPLAYTCFKAAAEEGTEAAYAPLGRMYVGGQGTGINFNLAREWYAKALHSGMKAIALEYNALCLSGDSLEFKSGEELFEWGEEQKEIHWRKDGKPVSASDRANKVFMFYWLAAEKGHTEAMKELASMFFLGSAYFATEKEPNPKGVGIRVDYRRSLDWYEQLALKGVVLPELQKCREFCEEGIYTKQEPPKKPDLPSDTRPR